jgi:hypothetical protein
VTALLDSPNELFSPLVSSDELLPVLERLLTAPFTDEALPSLEAEVALSEAEAEAEPELRLFSEPERDSEPVA